MNATDLIRDLVAAGITQQQIAHQIDTSQGHVSGLLNGRCKDPRHSLMVRLIALHRRHFPLGN